MNLEREISDHLEWIDAVASLLGEEQIPAERLQVISSHDSCSLGKWLQSDAPGELRASAEFDRLTESHERFHQLAGTGRPMMAWLADLADLLQFAVVVFAGGRKQLGILFV